MDNIKKLAKEMNGYLKQYGFRQQRTSPLFLYDCNWYFIFAELLKMGNDVYVINGIRFFWGYNNLAAIREETEDGLNYRITDASPQAIDGACKWIESKREYFSGLYKNPEEMLAYLKKYDDLAHLPHGYILARVLKNKAGVEAFERSLENRLKDINANPGMFFPYGSEAVFREVETRINETMRMDDEKFIKAVNEGINRGRKKLKLKPHGAYF